MPTETQEARELQLYIDNDYRLYQMRQAIYDNLTKKQNKGTYDHRKAPQAFSYLVEAGARAYAKEFATAPEWNKIFSVAVRKELAQEYADDFQADGLRGLGGLVSGSCSGGIVNPCTVGAGLLGWWIGRRR